MDKNQTPDQAAQQAAQMFSRMLRTFLVAVVALMAVQLMFPSQKPAQPATASGSVVAALKSKEGTVPHLPAITLENLSGTGFSFNPCVSLSLSFDGRAVDQKTFPEAVCRPVEIASGATAVLSEHDRGPLAPLYPLFAQPAEFAFRLDLPGGAQELKYSHVLPGTFKGFFLQAVYRPIYNLFVGIIRFVPGHSLGWAIVILTVIVRLVLLYPQHRMMVANRRMQAIQPKVKKLREKHKDDQQALGAAMLQLYREEGVSPLGSCLPLLLQMPVLIMLYWVIQEVGNASSTYFLYGFMGGFDTSLISQTFFGLDLSAAHNLGSLALAVLSTLAQFAQLWLSQARAKKASAGTPKPEKDPNVPDMEGAMKAMLWVMPLMVGASTYTFPAGVGVYWFVGTLFMTVQQFFANRATDGAAKKA